MLAPIPRNTIASSRASPACIHTGGGRVGTADEGDGGEGEGEAEGEERARNQLRSRTNSTAGARANASAAGCTPRYPTAPPRRSRRKRTFSTRTLAFSKPNSRQRMRAVSYVKVSA